MNSLLVFIITFFLAGGTTEVSPTTSEAGTWVDQEEATTTYYFIRHAEKDESDPSNKDPWLTAQGNARAKKWAEVLKAVSFDLIYSTDYKRTRATATAIADAQGKQVELYNPQHLNDPGFQKRTKGKKVLIVGHSNTTPAFVNAVLGEQKYEAIDEKENGALFIVNIAPDKSKSSQLLYIN